jgi:hypothetical protein
MSVHTIGRAYGNSPNCSPDPSPPSIVWDRVNLQTSFGWAGSRIRGCNMVDFAVVPEHTALVNVDMQNCFVQG